MSGSVAPRTVVVVGATGNQGGGVVRALLDSKSTGGNLWLVRGLTRDPNSTKAKNLLADHQTIDNRLTLVTGHVYDKASLQDAFAGAYGVFAITSESYPGRVLTKEKEMQHEIEAGRNIVLAAEECGIEHFVFSSLPDMVKTTGGRFLNIHHMNNKHIIEQFAREKLSGLTCLIPADGVVQFRIPIPGGQSMQWTDPIHDMGIFAARVFNLGIQETHGKSYLVLGPQITADDMVKTFTRVTGQAAVHEPISAEEFAELAVAFVGPAFKEDAKEMMEWAAVMPADKICYGAFDADQDHSVKELGLSATSFESWLYRSGWRGPA
ncbi:hypothetical protein PISL3812_03213 [Talaromyces islandicus]|uniref:NmrA-like domain-containing protein n=1 Tax=Talaromyces islandicus TaxID=28573 RepID=A0A0U1LUF5_TALIS|nr:hypothetical protein PISL3812_03213 [Talaromyces islandicus]